MGLFDKLKNVFFEVEYVEVEEPVKKDKDKVKEKEKVTVAKKIETPEIKKVKEEIVKKELDPEEDKTMEFEKEPEHDFKFPMDFDDKDFEITQKIASIKIKEPVVEESKPAYHESGSFDEKSEYHTSYQRLYEGSDQRKDRREVGFTPSLVISPIYGVLDKNYKKEQIVTKKEIRISASSNKVDLDSVREKAYGDLASEITESIHEDVKDENHDSDFISDDNLLYDLNEEDSPAVKVVTVGDAEEYFSDLGLEYNVDYKVEKDKRDDEEKNITRRSDRKRNSKEEVSTSEEISVSDVESRDSEKKNDKVDDSDNLFDLIDSMYEDKE